MKQRKMKLLIRGRLHVPGPGVPIGYGTVLSVMTDLMRDGKIAVFCVDIRCVIHAQWKSSGDAIV